MRVSFKALLHKYNTGECTPEEKAIIESWYHQLELPGLEELTDEQLVEIEQLRPSLPVKQRTRWPWISVAAAVAVLVTAGGYFLYHSMNTQKHQPIALMQDDALPGSNKAVLTLANGQRIMLEDAQKGALAQQGSIVIEKKADGELNYISGAELHEDDAPLINTVSTPRGGQHHLVLADGTQVWLNAASSITYPVTFNSQERKVEITGEGYFEVAQRDGQPFRVVSKGQKIDVLGTHFNVNAYPDEPVTKTTLLQGAVRVTADGGESAVLKPGQQAVLDNLQQIKVRFIDPEVAIDWKEGDFVFKNETLPDIMRKVSRWYDVDVDDGHYNHSKLTFSGEVSRSRNLSVVLKMLEATAGVKFTVKNNHITIADQ
ncbi:FecR family protein [Chitinophaga ginsengisoli]|uniref:FecR family protein n=1 Tax=Chitinophaga ginsengisoli TaxID=363837 RepID=A0A2P8FMR9_9BACT|nr:FecR domain-containing protein [Chitinophaga ginsengisoli]PSL23016.1 FecR family protein [Chitinophaga ginsengisoli]